MRHRWLLVTTLGLAAVVMSGTATQAQNGNTDACLGEGNAYDQLMCLVDLGEAERASAPCMAAANPGVRWQCVAIVAERIDDSGLCAEIPVDIPDGQELRDVCLSDIAEARASGALCADIATPGLKDSCYLGAVRAGADATLCGEIADAALKSACTGEPVTVD